MVKELGQGTFGSVSLMKDRRTGQIVAAKTLRNSNPYRGKVNEARIFKEHLASHPRITDLLACFLDRVPGSSQVLVFEYCDAGDLFDLIGKYKRHAAKIPEAFLWHLGTHLSEAVSYLHYGIRGSDTRGPSNWTPILHCDIKPENLLLRWPPGESRRQRYPDIVLADFGVAYITSDGSRFSADGGTPLYWPPESTKNSKKGDVWAMGATIHHAAHGFPPNKPLPSSYDKTSANEIRWLKQAQSKHVTHLRPRYSSFILDRIVCVSMLSFNVDQRLSSRELDNMFKIHGRSVRDATFKPLESWGI